MGINLLRVHVFLAFHRFWITGWIENAFHEEWNSTLLALYTESGSFTCFSILYLFKLYILHGCVFVFLWDGSAVAMVSHVVVIGWTASNLQACKLALESAAASSLFVSFTLGINESAPGVCSVSPFVYLARSHPNSDVAWPWSWRSRAEICCLIYQNKKSKSFLPLQYLFK